MKDKAISDPDKVVALMTDGQELRCFGSGWWLGPPPKPYQPSRSKLVTNEVVNALEAEGRIKIGLAGTSARAELTPAE